MKVIHVLNITCYKRSNKESVIHIGQILVKSDIIKLRIIMKTLFITHNQKLIITTSTKNIWSLHFHFAIKTKNGITEWTYWLLALEITQEAHYYSTEQKKQQKNSDS